MDYQKEIEDHIRSVVKDYIKEKFKLDITSKEGAAPADPLKPTPKIINIKVKLEDEVLQEQTIEV